MPSEIRHIVFQPPEVVRAIGGYYRRVGRPVPPGAVIKCGPERSGPTSPVRFRMTIEDDRPLDTIGLDILPPAESQTLVLEGSDLAAALILECRVLKIPLPASASKTLEIYGGQLCLAFSIASKNAIVPASEKPRL